MSGLPRKRAYTELEKGSRVHLDMSLIKKTGTRKEAGVWPEWAMRQLRENSVKEIIKKVTFS